MLAALRPAQSQLSFIRQFFQKRIQKNSASSCQNVVQKLKALEQTLWHNDASLSSTNCSLAQSNIPNEATYATYISQPQHYLQVISFLQSIKGLQVNDKIIQATINNIIDDIIKKLNISPYLQKIAQRIREQDAGYLKENLRCIIQRTRKFFASSQAWSLNRGAIGTQLVHLMRVLATQIEIYSYYNVIFPDWLPFKKLFIKTTKIFTITKLEQDSKLSSNEYAKQSKKRNNILKDYQNKYKYVDPIMMTKEGPQSITKYLSNKFPRTIGWKQIFSALKRDLKSEEEQKYFIKQIHDERPMPKDLLCCSQFVYEGMDCFNEQIDCLNDVDFIDDSQKMNQVDIKQKVLSLMNAKGGILVFDVYQHLADLIIEGKVLNEQNKEQTQSRINSYLECIAPKITINKQYKFRWVPVMQNPTRYLSQAKQNEKDYYKVRKFKTGRWLLMLIITPTNPQITYHYSINNNNFFIQRTEDKKKRQLQAKDVYPFIKNRFTKYYSKKGFEHAHDIYPFFDTLKGQQIFGEQKGIQQIRKQNAQKGQNFKFHSLIVVDRTNREKVEDVLRKQKVDFLFEQAFATFNFRLASTTWILHHNTKFDKVKLVINQNNLRYSNNSKSVILISTTKTLQTSYIEQAGVKNLQAWIKGIYPNQSVVFEQKQHDYFLSTQTVMGCIFMYMLLDNYQIRARFKKMTSEENKIPNPSKKGRQSMPDQ